MDTFSDTMLDTCQKFTPKPDRQSVNWPNDFNTDKKAFSTGNGKKDNKYYKGNLCETFS